MIDSKSDRVNIWLDCSPSLNDCFTIIMAATHPKFNLIGVSTTGGRTTLDKATRNAADFLYHIGK